MRVHVVDRLRSESGALDRGLHACRDTDAVGQRGGDVKRFTPGRVPDDLRIDPRPARLRVRERLDDRNRRAVIMAIMCRKQVDYAELSAELQLDVPRVYAAEIESLADLEAARRLGVGVRTAAVLETAEPAVAAGVTDPGEGALRPPRWQPTP